MSGPPDALQRLPAILNFSGGRSSAFMLYHLLEHDDGRLQAKRPWSQATLSAVASSTPPDLRRALEPLRHRNPPELIESDEDVRIPIELPVGKERGAVLDAVVARLDRMAYQRKVIRVRHPSCSMSSFY